MKAGSVILLDFLLYFVKNGYFLAVYDFLDSLAVLVPARNLCGYFYGFIVVLIFPW